MLPSIHTISKAAEVAPTWDGPLGQASVSTTKHIQAIDTTENSSFTLIYIYIYMYIVCTVENKNSMHIQVADLVATGDASCQPSGACSPAPWQVR